MKINRTEIRNIIFNIIGEAVEMEDDDDLAIYGIDSMLTIRLIVELEERFNITIPEESLLLSEFNTIDSIYRYLSKSKCRYNNSYDRDDKVAVVTGANRGIGYGIAYALYQEGYTVVSLNRTCIGVDWMKEIQCDLKNIDEIRESISFIEELYDGIDLLVNNAGIREFARADRLTEKQWEESLLTNFIAPMNLTCIALKRLVKRKGLVVFIGSSAYNHTFEGGAAYSCSKAALHTLSESLIKDFRYEDIRLCYISLGATEIDNDKFDSTWKIKPSDVGQLICLIGKLPSNVMPAFIDLRPSKPLRSEEVGLERLQVI